MCMSDPETALVIGGEAMDQALCRDTLWKLEIGEDCLDFDYKGFLDIMLWLTMY